MQDQIIMQIIKREEWYNLKIKLKIFYLLINNNYNKK